MKLTSRHGSSRACAPGALATITMTRCAAESACLSLPRRLYRRQGVNNMVSKNVYHMLAVILGIVGSILAVLAVLVFENWLTPALVDNFSATELGAFSALAITGAIASSAAEKYE